VRPDYEDVMFDAVRKSSEEYLAVREVQDDRRRRAEVRDLRVVTFLRTSAEMMLAELRAAKWQGGTNLMTLLILRP
jgi:hypothetical protein